MRCLFAALVVAFLAAKPAMADSLWDGFYVGFFGGRGVVKATLPADSWLAQYNDVVGYTNPQILGPPGTAIDPIGPSSIKDVSWLLNFAQSAPVVHSVGLTAGWQRTVAGGLVVGLEGNISGVLDPLTHIEYTPDNGLAGSLDKGLFHGVQVEMLARLGYAANDRIMTFGTVGIAVDDRGFFATTDVLVPAGLKIYSTPDDNTVFDQKTTHTAAGSAPYWEFAPVIGGGVDVALTDNLRLKASYLAKLTPPATTNLHVSAPASADLPMMVNAYVTNEVRVGLLLPIR